MAPAAVTVTWLTPPSRSSAATLGVLAKRARAMATGGAGSAASAALASTSVAAKKTDFNATMISQKRYAKVEV